MMRTPLLLDKRTRKNEDAALTVSNRGPHQDVTAQNMIVSDSYESYAGLVLLSLMFSVVFQVSRCFQEGDQQRFLQQTSALGEEQ